jgi:hypothetical protein
MCYNGVTEKEKSKERGSNMNELIILFILACAFICCMVVGCPIAYIVYRVEGGTKNFFKWFIFEV